MPHDHEEREVGSKMREKNLINEFWMKDGVDYDKLKNEVKKNYELSFEDPRPEAWKQRSGIRRLRSRDGVNPDCIVRCTEYVACAALMGPWVCKYLKEGCTCEFP